MARVSGPHFGRAPYPGCTGQLRAGTAGHAPVSVSERPYVAILVDGHRVATVQLGLSVVFDVSAVLARVRAGRLAGVHTGSCDITATLAIDDIDVASKKAHRDLPGEIALRHELRLLPARDYPPGENNATAADDVKA